MNNNKQEKINNNLDETRRIKELLNKKMKKNL